MRRAAVSVPSNIAEGHAYGTATRCVFHLRVAVGSIGELDTQFEVAVRLKFVAESDVTRPRAELTRTRQLVQGLLRAKQVQLLKSAGRGLALLLAPTVGWLLLAALD
jgi:four helix bundle protein